MSDKKMTVELTESEMISISVALSYYENNKLNDETRKRLKEIEEHKSDKDVKLAQDLLLYTQEIRIRNLDIYQKLSDMISQDFDGNRKNCAVENSDEPKRVQNEPKEWGEHDTVYFPVLDVDYSSPIKIGATYSYSEYGRFGRKWVDASLGFRTEEEAISVAQKWLDDAKQKKQSK